VRYRGYRLAGGWLVCAAIVWLSLMPSPPSVGFEYSDKLGHFVAYGALMYWFCQLYASRTARLGYAIGFAAMGIALEFIQGALGYRSFEVADMGANALGVLLGWAAAFILPRALPGAGRGTR
jgi:VanZ family protein